MTMFWQSLKSCLLRLSCSCVERSRPSAHVRCERSAIATTSGQILVPCRSSGACAYILLFLVSYAIGTCLLLCLHIVAALCSYTLV